MAIAQPTDAADPDPIRRDLVDDARWQPPAVRPAAGALSDAAHDPTRQPPPADPHPADPRQLAGTSYTASDTGTGITSDSLAAWQTHRGKFGTFVRADIADVAGSAGPSYTGRPGVAPVNPTLVLTDDQSRRLALNGTPSGFDGEGPRAAALILAQEGLLTEEEALPTLISRRQLTVQRAATAPGPAVLPDAIALDPAHLQVWSALERWREACSAVDPRLPTDPHYPALAAALDRVDAAGIDVQAALARATASGQLPEASPGRALHSRLTASCAAALTPTPPPAVPSAPPSAPGASPATSSRPVPGRSDHGRAGPKL